MNDETILLAHGSGSRLSHELIEKNFLPPLANPLLAKLDDSAVFDLSGRLAFTTDSYVVNPIFFPGGDIGKLAVCGTVNDLSMSGARPLYLSLSFIIEEGFPVAELKKVIASIKKAADEAEVSIVTGDTKVVNRGSADKLFINTAGVGIVPEGIDISAVNARPGDRIIVSGNIGDHGIAVLSQREGLEFKLPVPSDCAPLNGMVAGMLAVSRKIRCLRDPTRGGLATTLNEIAAQAGVGMLLREQDIPVKPAVAAACEFLGLDPLYVANEGVCCALVAPEIETAALEIMRRHAAGNRAVCVGSVRETHPGKVIMQSSVGGSRIVTPLLGEQLPRIC